MATYTCDDCGKPLGVNATACPSCGKRWTHNSIDNVHGKLSEINAKLAETNANLAATNANLAETNRMIHNWGLLWLFLIAICEVLRTLLPWLAIGPWS
tara:strand:+ start:210 stop:503 length:294 start_codon:yes stop_codon:yes gene_type:complete